MISVNKNIAKTSIQFQGHFQAEKYSTARAHSFYSRTKSDESMWNVAIMSDFG